ncbi:MAG: DUF4175 family protein [Deltaproteobacteria bacterium]|nr:DUF4175 family protein [Deltaproteobacteria bacterium]
MVTFRKLEANLAKLGQDLTRVRRFWFLAKSSIFVITSLSAAIVFAELGWVRPAFYIFIAGVVFSVFLYFWNILVRLGRSSSEAVFAASAALAEQLAPELGSAPSSALDFSRRLATSDDSSFSHDLAKLHLERTDEALNKIDLHARWRVYDKNSRFRRWAILTICCAIGVLIIVFFAQGRQRLLNIVVDANITQIVDAPLAADIRITYHYPAYTGLQEHTIEGGDGSISAVIGTEVELSANTDEPVRKATLKIDTSADVAKLSVPMTVNGRQIGARFLVQQNAHYNFALDAINGEKLEERQAHTINAIIDVPPIVKMIAPVDDIELRDNQNISVIYEAKDDFGVTNIDLIVELPFDNEPKHISLVNNIENTLKSEGIYTWRVADLELAPGSEARFYLEAKDNNAIAGSQRAVSATRKLILFSARKHHDDLLQRQQHILDIMVDWLAAELVTANLESIDEKKNVNVPEQEKLLENIKRLTTELNSLIPLLREDKLANDGVALAYANIRSHVQKTERERTQLLHRLKNPSATKFLYKALAREVARSIKELEKDIIYLDDLLAIERIDQLKSGAKDLLASQRHLQKLLSQYKQTKDPQLRAELTSRMQQLKKQMIQLLSKMAAIKQQLPGEYRNLESAAQLEVGDELKRIEQALEQGDFDNAARELEQLASMIENMSDHLDNAEKMYGDERYSKVRQQLAAFASQFEELATEQQNLAQRSEMLAKQFRDKTLERVGSKVDEFVRKTRAITAQALLQLDQVQPSLLKIFGIARSLQFSRDRLLDLDALLAQKDFATALQMSAAALSYEAELQKALSTRIRRYGNNASEIKRANNAANRAEKLTSEVANLLDKLFPDVEQVLDKKQIERMRNMSRKQTELENKATKLAEQMQELSGQVPLFGGEPRTSLDNARDEMSQAHRDLDKGELPGGAQHGRQAANELQKLRQALKEATKSGQGGLPLPLNMAGQFSNSSQGQDQANGKHSNEDVHIPDADSNRANPIFRQELLEAAKQKAPQHYEDAVRHYYQELIK